MPALSECLPGVLVTVLGKGFMYQAHATDQEINKGMLEAAERMSVGGGVNVFVSRDTALDPAFRRYLDQLDPRARATHVVTVLDPATSLAVSDPETLRSVAAGLDLPVSTVEPIAGEDVVPVDVTGRVTALEAAGYRILPPSAVAQRAALLDAVRLSEAPSSIQEGLERLAGWHEKVGRTRTDLGLASPEEVAHTGPGIHATTYALGAYVARYGQSPASASRYGQSPASASRYGQSPAFAPLTSTEPLMVDSVASAIGGDLTPVSPAVLAHLLHDAPGSSALVTGTAAGTTTEQVFWLTSDENGALAWHDPRAADATQLFSMDGGNDWRTAVLEREDARAMLVGPDGVPVALPEPGEAVVGPRHHEVTYVGPWPQTNLSKYGLDSVDITGLPIVAVDVRYQSGEGLPLDREQFVEIRATLQRYYLNNVRPMVIATRQHHEIEQLAQTYEATVVQHKVQPGIDDRSEWQVIRPGEASKTFDVPVVTAEILNAASLPGTTAREPLPPVLVEFLTQGSYQQAAEHLAANADQLRDPAVLTAAEGLAANFPGDLRLQGLDLALRVAAREPIVNGAPIEPTDLSLFHSKQPWPAGRSLDARFVFDYLTSSTGWRKSESTSDDQVHGNRMTWDTLLLQGMLDGLVDPTDAVTLVHAVGESYDERAAWAAAKGKEVAQAHASIFDAVKLLLSNDWVAGSDGWRQVLSSVNCLSGADRVPWHFRLQRLLKSGRFAETSKLADDFRALINEIMLCQY
jgi:hypothetical protein